MGGASSQEASTTKVQPFIAPPNNLVRPSTPMSDAPNLTGVLPSPKEAWNDPGDAKLYASETDSGACERARRSSKVSVGSKESRNSRDTKQSSCGQRSGSIKSGSKESIDRGAKSVGAFDSGGPSSRRVAMTSTAKMQMQIKMALEQERKARDDDMKVVSTRRVNPRCIVENNTFIALTTILTIYALIGDDFRLIFTSRPADSVFDGITCSTLLVFTGEIVLSCLGKPDYFGSFFFYLDAISTVTLVLDITFINEWLLTQGDGDNMRSSRIARLGARASRVVRVIRLVRILKLYKAYYEARQRAAAAKLKDKKFDINDDDWDDVVDDDPPMTESMTYESKVGKKLADLTTRRCVIIILSMLLGYNFLVVTEDVLLPTAQEYGAQRVLEAFQTMQTNSTRRGIYEQTLLQYIYFFNWYAESDSEQVNPSPADWDASLYWFGVTGNDYAAVSSNAAEAKLSASSVQYWEKSYVQPDLVFDYVSMPASVQTQLGSTLNAECKIERGSKEGWTRLGKSLISQGSQHQGRAPATGCCRGVSYTVQCPEDLRANERLSAVAGDDSLSFIFYFDVRTNVQSEAEFNFYTTCFVCVVLCTASMMFSADANELVVKPVEAMMLKVDMIRINPFIAASMTDDAFKKENIDRARSLKFQKTWKAKAKGILQTLTCTGASEKQNRPMETMILEKTIIKLGTLLAIGFGTAGMNIISQNLAGQDSAALNAMIPGGIVECIIGHARICNFGTFTEVLQSRVLTFVNQVSEVIHGAVDAHFGAPSVNNGDAFLYVWKKDDDYNVANMAVTSTAVMIAGIERSTVLNAYREHPGLRQRMGANTRVAVTFGLHAGWAIEGALGSEYKIDASYVSPHASIAVTAEGCAQKYGTNNIITEATIQCMTSGFQKLCRLIDNVKLRGSPKPMELYTLDLYNRVLDVEEPVKTLKRWGMRQRFRARQALDAEKLARQNNGVRGLLKSFEDNEDLNRMRRPYGVAFTNTFSMGYQNYSEGEWAAARNFFQRSRQVLGIPDGPTAALLEYMGQTDFQAPRWWKGVRCFEDDGAGVNRTNGDPYSDEEDFDFEAHDNFDTEPMKFDQEAMPVDHMVTTNTEGSMTFQEYQNKRCGSKSAGGIIAFAEKLRRESVRADMVVSKRSGSLQTSPKALQEPLKVEDVTD